MQTLKWFLETVKVVAEGSGGRGSRVKPAPIETRVECHSRFRQMADRQSKKVPCAHYAEC